jgi:hypothetical protein
VAKTIFILAAGASREDGAPVMRDFLGGMSQSERRKLKEVATAKNKLLKK